MKIRKWLNRLFKKKQLVQTEFDERVEIIDAQTESARSYTQFKRLEIMIGTFKNDFKDITNIEETVRKMYDKVNRFRKDRGAIYPPSENTETLI